MREVLERHGNGEDGACRALPEYGDGLFRRCEELDRIGRRGRRRHLVQGEIFDAVRPLAHHEPGQYPLDIAEEADGDV